MEPRTLERQLGCETLPDATDGWEIEWGVTFGPGGAMYGVAVEGGTPGLGMIFKITP
jgi:hypothetical protein